MSTRARARTNCASGSVVLPHVVAIFLMRSNTRSANPTFTLCTPFSMMTPDSSSRFSVASAVLVFFNAPSTDLSSVLRLCGWAGWGRGGRERYVSHCNDARRRNVRHGTVWDRWPLPSVRQTPQTWRTPSARTRMRQRPASPALRTRTKHTGEATCGAYANPNATQIQ